MAESLRTAVERSRMNPLENAKITVSIGVTTVVPLNVNDFEKLISAADTALYMAKNAGRNRVEFSEFVSGTVR